MTIMNQITFKDLKIFLIIKSKDLSEIIKFAIVSNTLDCGGIHYIQIITNQIAHVNRNKLLKYYNKRKSDISI
jgi:hypothetical protein